MKGSYVGGGMKGRTDREGWIACCDSFREGPRFYVSAKYLSIPAWLELFRSSN